jgi:ankyrin repeat protein
MKSHEAPLYCAISSGNVGIVKYLISKGANVNQYTLVGTPLLNAISDKYALDRAINIEIIKFLISNGAFINSDGVTYSEAVLKTAIKKGNLEMVKFLVSNGAFINGDGATYSEAVLETAIEEGNLEIVKFLIASGAKVTGIVTAVGRGHLDIVKFLVSTGRYPDPVHTLRCYIERLLQSPYHSAVVEYFQELESQQRRTEDERQRRQRQEYELVKSKNDVTVYKKFLDDNFSQDRVPPTDTHYEDEALF